MEDVAYQDDEISQINDVIEVEQLTSLCDIGVEDHQVDASNLLLESNMDEGMKSLDQRSILDQMKTIKSTMIHNLNRSFL